MTRYKISGNGANQIAASTERAILAGDLAPGQRLPTVRSLAHRLGVSPATVTAAYHSLKMRGLISAAGRHGTVVNPMPPLITRPAPPVPPSVRNLANGAPDLALLPPIEKALARIHSTRGYGEPYNHPDLIELAAANFRNDGIAVGPIAIVSGALDGIERLLQANLRTGDRVAIEDPGYPPILDLIAALGLRAQACGIDDSGPLSDELKWMLKAGVAAIIVTPRAQNPTGAALSHERAEELRRVLKGSPEVMIIEDDHAGPIAGAPALTLCDPGRRRWAIVRSVSKSLGPDLRLAFVSGDTLTIGRLEGRQRLGPGWVSHILQEAVVAIWSDPETAQLVGRAAAAYAERRGWLIEALASRGITAHGRSGLNVWVPVPEELTVMQSMMSAGWALSAGERYRLKSAPAVRVSIATLTKDETIRLAQDLSRSLAPSRRVHYA